MTILSTSAVQCPDKGIEGQKYHGVKITNLDIFRTKVAET